MSPSTPEAARAQAVEAARASLDAEIETQRSDGSIPGLALAVTDRDRLLIGRTYGVAEIGSGRPVGPDTLFEIGSIGKTFTALVILALEAEGRLRVDDPVVRHLPWFRVPRTGDRITLHHLLSHTAGITAGVEGTPEATFQVWRLRDLPPGSAPGRRFHYSNLGYKALGLVIEAVEGEPYPAVVQRRILDPLGMTETVPAITNDVRDRLAVGYGPAHDDRPWTEGDALAPATWLETATADGSLASTATDMAIFLRALMARPGRTRGPDGDADPGHRSVGLRLRALAPRDRRTDLHRPHRWHGRLHLGPRLGPGRRHRAPSCCRAGRATDRMRSHAWRSAGCARPSTAVTRTRRSPRTSPRCGPATPTPTPNGRAPPGESRPRSATRSTGTYRSHDPWMPVFRVEARDDVLQLILPGGADGLDEEQPLVPMARGWYRVGADRLGRSGFASTRSSTAGRSAHGCRAGTTTASRGRTLTRASRLSALRPTCFSSLHPRDPSQHAPRACST